MKVLNVVNQFDNEEISNVRQTPVHEELYMPPNMKELDEALGSLKSIYITGLEGTMVWLRNW